MRADLETIQEWIPTDSRILDLDCGGGELLAWLRDHKQVNGYSLEIGPGNITRCIEDGVNVIEQDLDRGLGNFVSDSLDAVVTTQVLQVVHYPGKVLEGVLQVGKTCIITLLNFGHWRCRWYPTRSSRVPVSGFPSYTWYNMLNIHFCIFWDFEHLRRQLRMHMLDHLAVDRDHRHGWANWP